MHVCLRISKELVADGDYSVPKNGGQNADNILKEGKQE